MLYELKRVVLGEFMDDLHLASRLNEFFGVQDENESTAMD